jgi:hypothetical protein
LYEEVFTSSLNNMDSKNAIRKLIKITDILGREVDITKIKEETTLLYIYDNGTVEKRIVIE